MTWAREWQSSEGWDHRLRILCDYDAERIDYHRREVHLGRLARMWKSHLSENAYERTGGGASRGGRL